MSLSMTIMSLTPSVCFLITTFNRSDTCFMLCDKLDAFGDIYIVDDNSTQGYSWANKYNYLKLDAHNGKAGYYSTVSTLWSMVKDTKYDYYFFIQDDIIIDPNMVKKAISTWERISNPSLICLNLWASASRDGVPCWTNYMPVKETAAIRTQWTDMAAFLCKREFFEFFNWQLPQVEIKSHMSSGVGRHISIELHKAGYAIYQVYGTLVYPAHNAMNSKMNPWRDKNENLLLHQMISGKTRCQIASIPSRAKSLEKAAMSLLPQVDELFIALNGYNKVPSWITKNKIEYIILDNSSGDAAKFYNVEDYDGYFLSADDDLEYPSDYVQKIVDGINKYKCIVSYHGRVFRRPYSGFNRFTLVFRFSETQTADTAVDIGGTGVMGFHTDHFKIKYSDFLLANMADVWVAKIAKLSNCKIMALRHSSTEIRQSKHKENIHDQRMAYKWDQEDAILAELYNNGPIFKRKERIVFEHNGAMESGIILTKANDYYVIKHKNKGFWTRKLVHESMISKLKT